MIKPTLFVGLGTTGTDILKTLRELMSEEYENAGLPIFRYISIETQEKETGDNSSKFKDYEQIEVVNATIDETTKIREQLDPNQPIAIYQPQLAEWLNPALLNEYESFKDGASNIRMAGRLCLWHNWQQIRRTLSTARNRVVEDVNRQETLDILTQHYQAKGLDVPNQLVDDNGINVYVVGTLCGGTCSGMLIDIAYLIRSILGRGDTNEVNGIFTMYDQLLAESTDDDIAARAANCYTSLSELNYYNHSKVMYDVVFPNRQRLDTYQKPYNYDLIVSPTGRNDAFRFVAGGEVDEAGLSLMVALNLFAESAGDTGGRKRAIRTDWRGFGVGYGQLKDVLVGEIPTMTRCLASFGLTAVWYPKYRIASAAACFASKELCDNLKGGHTSDKKINANAINEWNNIRVNVDILTSPQVDGRPTLKSEIEDHLNNLEGEVLNRKSSAQQLERMLKSYPGSDAGSFKNRFSRSGTYYAWIEGEVDNCKKAFRDAIGSALQNQLSKVFDSPSSYGINDVQKYFEELDSVIKATQGRIKNELPDLNLDQLDFSGMKRAEKNPWTRGSGKREESVSLFRESLVKEYRQLIIGDAVGIYHKVRYYFLRQVLDDVRAKLGFEGSSETNTVKQQLEDIQSNLDSCITTLTDKYDEYIRPPGYECVKIVANNPQNSIEIDAKTLAGQIVDESTSINNEVLLEDGQPIANHEFLKKSGEYLSQQMSETYQSTALNKINAGDEEGPASSLVVTKVQSLLENDDNQIRDLANRSNPYQNFSGSYRAIQLDRGTKIVFGHDPPGASLTVLQNAIRFDRTGGSSVDHLLFFYEEEAGFTFDDLAVYEALKNHFENGPKLSYRGWTHQNPNFYDLKLQPKSSDLKRWCRALEKLVPKIKEAYPAAFNSVFKFEHGNIIFSYKNRVNVAQFLVLSDDANSINNLCTVENDDYYNYFFNSVKDEFNRLGPHSVSVSVNDLLEQIDMGERGEMSGFYTQFLEEIFPDSGEATFTPPSAEPEVVSSSSENIPQTSHDTTDEEQSDTSIGGETGLTFGELQRIRELLDKQPREWTQEDHTLMEGFNVRDISRIQELLNKSPREWIQEDHILMQRIQQNFERIDSDGELQHIRELLDKQPREWTQEDHTLMEGFNVRDISHIQELLDKPQREWTQEDHVLMQRIQQNFERIDSEQKTSTDQSRGVTPEGVDPEEVDPDEMNNPQK